jgi:hypothetical protein
MINRNIQERINMSKWNGDKARHAKHAKRRALLRLKSRALRQTLAGKSGAQAKQDRENKSAS